MRVHVNGKARLARTSEDGQAGADAGVLEDYGDVAEGFLAPASATGEEVRLEFAGFLVDLVLDRFTAEDGSLYDTAAPSGWTAAAGALLSYAAHTESETHRTAAERALAVVHALGPRAPRFIGHGPAGAEALLDGPREVAVVCHPEDPDRAALHRTALLGTAPGAVVAVGLPRAADGSGGEFPPAGRAHTRTRPSDGVCVSTFRLRAAYGRSGRAGRAVGYGSSLKHPECRQFRLAVLEFGNPFFIHTAPECHVRCLVSCLRGLPESGRKVTATAHRGVRTRGKRKPVTAGRGARRGLPGV